LTPVDGFVASTPLVKVYREGRWVSLLWVGSERRKRRRRRSVFRIVHVHRRRRRWRRRRRKSLPRIVHARGAIPEEEEEEEIITSSVIGRRSSLRSNLTRGYKPLSPNLVLKISQQKIKMLYRPL
jgi:hypothetical protein